MRRVAGSMDSQGEHRADYFRRSNLFVMVAILAGLSYCGLAVFSPSTIPYDLLGPLGTVTKYLVENHKTLLNIGYLVTWLGHVGEALVALKLCKMKGITDPSTQRLWLVQTFFFGMGSLYLLLTYNPRKKSW
ncbi:transmembrane protein 254-like [Podarcis raffonei]|uniref:transmembrane protein 254-like n=1 Tax=Podarcis raffonei TaxID=65483 RepID=UPI0023296061|nr:transmembrane protein 254-like [Podarcis raffonei]